MKTERRHASQAVEIRNSDDGTPQLTGYAAVFYRADDPGTEYALAEDYIERIAPGAFAATLVADDIRGLFNHSADKVLGRVKSGTMRLAEDEKGLRYEIDLPDTATGNEVRELVKRGDITGSSFGFIVTGQEHEERADGVLVRNLTGVSLVDLGPVTFPAYKSTEVHTRAEDHRATPAPEPEPVTPRDVVAAVARCIEIDKTE